MRDASIATKLSNLDDPRVLFAAERTLMAWSRTTAGLMALGFFIDRSALYAGEGSGRGPAFWIGVAFVALGVALSLLSIVQFRRSVASLRPVEVPPGYWVNLAMYAALGVGALGSALVVYMALL